MATSRYFYRCPDCLTVVALEAERSPNGGVVEWSAAIAGNRQLFTEVLCGVCPSTRLELMGRVEADRLVKDRMRDACDARCLCAVGPSCSCRCLGKNHGAGLLVTLTSDVVGGIPRVSPTEPAGLFAEPSRAARIGQEWRELCEATMAAIHGAYPEIMEKAGGARVASWARLLEGREQQRAYHAIRSMRSNQRVRRMTDLRDRQRRAVALSA